MQRIRSLQEEADRKRYERMEQVRTDDTRDIVSRFCLICFCFRSFLQERVVMAANKKPTAAPPAAAAAASAAAAAPPPDDPKQVKKEKRPFFGTRRGKK